MGDYAIVIIWIFGLQLVYGVNRDLSINSGIANEYNYQVIFVWSNILAMEDIFEVLVEPNPRRILELLRGGDRPVGEIVSALGLSQPAVSKHLQVLKQASLVDVHPDAQRRVYQLRPESLSKLDAWLAPYRELVVATPRRPRAASRHDA